MKVIKFLLLLVSCSVVSFYSYAEDSGESETAPATSVPHGKPLSEQEVEAHIGRLGETDEVPADFKYNEAEIKLWLSDHLANIHKPVSLYYEFVKSGTFEEGFTDSVYLNVMKLNDDGTKNTRLDFFTAERKQAVSPDNTTHIRGNPVVGIYMQGDVYEMNRLTEGHWRHFQKQIKVALRKNEAVVEPTTFTFNGKEYKGEKIHFAPYLNDPHRRDFEKFADKYYEFIFSDEIPGSLYQIKTVIPDKNKENAEPLIQETLTLMDIESTKS